MTEESNRSITLKLGCKGPLGLYVSPLSNVGGTYNFSVREDLEEPWELCEFETFEQARSAHNDALKAALGKNFPFAQS